MSYCNAVSVTCISASSAYRDASGSRLLLRSGAMMRSVRRRRGVIFVEGLMMILILSILFGSTFFIAAGYFSALHANQEAMAKAWQDAMPGCGDPMGGASDFDRWLNKEISEPSVAEIVGRSPEPTLLGTIGWTTVRTERRTFDAPAVLGGETQEYETSVRLLCNEKGLSSVITQAEKTALDSIIDVGNAPIGDAPIAAPRKYRGPAEVN